MSSPTSRPRGVRPVLSWLSHWMVSLLVKDAVDSTQLFQTTKRIARLVRRYGQGNCLDAGCGTGAYLPLYRGHMVVGLDLTDEYLDQARAMAQQNLAASLLRGEVRTLPFKNGSFDCILCVDVLEYLEPAERQEALRELDRVCRTGGTVVVSGPNADCVLNPFRWMVYGKGHTASAPEFPQFTHIGVMLTLRELRQNGFEVHGGVGWVTRARLRLPIIADLLDTVAWRFPRLGGIVIAVKRRQGVHGGRR